MGYIPCSFVKVDIGFKPKELLDLTLRKIKHASRSAYNGLRGVIAGRNRNPYVVVMNQEIYMPEENVNVIISSTLHSDEANEYFPAAELEDLSSPPSQ